MDSPYISQQFEILRKQFPDKTALLYEGKTWTYETLYEMSLVYRQMFEEAGIQEGHLVAIHLSRSPEWIAIILALISMRAVYLPLDPKLPEERKQLILKKSKAPFLFSSNTITRIQTEDFFLGKDAFYVIYTSGSSGEPKGVVGTHRWIQKRISWMHTQYPIHSDEVLCMKTPLSFVDHVAELFQALLNPAPLSILKDEEVQDVLRFRNCIERDQITRLVIVPSLLKIFLQTDVSALPLRYIFSSGELLSTLLAQECMGKIPNARLINIYGSTEVGADATFFEVKSFEGVSIPIGSPIPGATVQILDEQMREVSFDTVGQIHIGGDCLALGYLHDEALTSKSFQTGLFATGDYGKKLASGAIEYSGRKDQQVKIRGCRVDLIEVEQRMLQIPQIEQACAVVHHDELFAFYTSSSKKSEDEIRNYLRLFFPEYMIPSHLLPLQDFPLLPSGKIDRQSLIKETMVVLSPSNNLFDRLKNLCRYLLKLETVNEDTNFFDLGFNSLSINNLAIHLRQGSLTDLYAYPTIRALAAHLQKG